VPSIKSCPCPVTSLSNGICLAFGVLQQSTPCTTSGHCNRRSPWQHAILFSASTPPQTPLDHIKKCYSNVHYCFIHHSATFSTTLEQPRELDRIERMTFIHQNIHHAGGGDRCLLKERKELTPCSKVLPEKLKRPTLLNKFPTFYGTQRFIAVFTTGHHLCLSWARSIQSVAPPPTKPLDEPF
jgi:hypothetical protein